MTKGKACKRRLREYFALLLRLLGPGALRSFAGLPRVGKFAEALALHRQPFVAPPPRAGGPLAADKENEADCDAPAAAIPTVVHYAAHAPGRAQRIALLAHWDPDGLVDAYVLRYAAAIKDLGYSVVLASAGEVRVDEAAGRLFDAVLHRTCAGYDFTSWKAAFAAFPSLYQAREILLVNDSVFAPVGDLKPLYASMGTVDCDFWGVLESHAIRPHLQSYWLVFRKNAVAHPAFRVFWDQLKPTRDKREAIGQETRFAAWLQRHGLRGASRFPQSCFTPSLLNPSHYAWDSLLETGCFPFLKRELLFENPYAVPLRGVPERLRSAGYPLSFLTAYARRRNLTLPCGSWEA